MELYQMGLGEYAKRMWQHYGHIDKCQDCGSELRVTKTDTGEVYGPQGLTYKTAYVSKECVSCPTLAREIYPLEV